MYKCNDNQMLPTWCDLNMINNNSAGPGLFIDLKTKQTNTTTTTPFSEIETNFCAYVHVSVL